MDVLHKVSSDQNQVRTDSLKRALVILLVVIALVVALVWRRSRGPRLVALAPEVSLPADGRAKVGEIRRRPA